MRFLVTCFLCITLSTIASGIPLAKGQQPSATPMRQQEQKPAAGNATAERRVLLREGTQVHLKLAQTITSKTSSIGEPVEMVLAEDLTVGEDVVVQKGARVLGTVVAGKQSERQKSEAHELRVRADHIKVGDSFIKLTGDQAGIGKRDKEKMVTYSILFGLSGLLASSGKTFVIPEGTAATAYVQEDIVLAVLPPGSNGSSR